MARTDTAGGRPIHLCPGAPPPWNPVAPATGGEIGYDVRETRGATVTARDQGGSRAEDRPEVVVLVGLQASGKSTFFRQRFADTHLHVSKDLMRNVRRKEVRQHALIESALARGASVVVDNTNPSVEERQRIITLARSFHARVVGYWFPPDVPTMLARNAAREGRERVPDVGFFATLKRLVPPRPEEGFDQLFVVRARTEGLFDVEPWQTGRDPDPDAGQDQDQD